MPRNGTGQAVGASQVRPAPWAFPLMSRQGLAMASNHPRQGVGKVGSSQGALDARARAARLGPLRARRGRPRVSRAGFRFSRVRGCWGARTRGWASSSGCRGVAAAP